MPIQRSLLPLLLLAGCLSAAHAAPEGAVAPRAADATEQAAPDKNAILGLTAEASPQGGWRVTVDYQFTGVPQGAQLVVKHEASLTASDLDTVAYGGPVTPLVPGRHSIKVKLRIPADERVTRMLVAEIWDPQNVVIARLQVPQFLAWADPALARADGGMAGEAPDVVLKRAVGLIDTNRSSALREAKLMLERLVNADPRMDAAYLELARVAMKTNWGPQGLREAEALVKSSLQLRPESVNAKILLGYVYANQGRHADGAALFEEAARAGTDNLWLWTNWGELLASQGRHEAAIAKFREALRHPPSADTHDRARHHAYMRLLNVYDLQPDLDAMDALHRQRRADYPGAICYDFAHARFLVTMRGDPAAAQAVLDSLPQEECEAGEGRMLVSLVRYLAWAKAKEPQRAEALRLARVSAPVSPYLLRTLAESDQTLLAARQLVAAGEDIAMQDNHRMDALALALADRDARAASRLLSIGAPTNTLVGHDQVPVALLPVMMGDAEGCALMQRAGVDYGQLRFRGVTALDIARQSGDEDLLRVLQSRAKRL